MYSYIRLSFVFEKSLAFFVLQLCFFTIWGGFGSYMQRVFSQTVLYEIRIFVPPKDGV